MIHHLQTLIIVLSMNVSWPRFVWVVSEVVGSVVNTEDHVAAIACVFKSHDSSEASNGGAYFFYIQLSTFAVLPFFLGGIGFIYWLQIAPKCRCLRCGVEDIRESKLMDCCRQWGREEVIMVPQPPPILPSTGTDSTTENRPTMTLADLRSRGSRERL